MIEHYPKLLGLPTPCNPQVKTKSIKPNQRTSEINKETVVYGRDLNTSDILLLGVDKPLKRIIADEYGIGSNFSWEYPSVFSTTSRKVIIDDGEHKYFIKEKPKYCCNPYSLSLAAQFQDFLSEKTDFVPRIIHTKSGNPYLKIGETLFFTTEYINGRIFNASIRDVESAGATLGKMHLLSQEFSFPNLHKKYSTEDALEFINMADQLNGAQGDRWRQKTVQALMKIADKYGDQLDKDVPYIINHGDYAPFNFVYNKKDIIALNDFDNVGYRPRIRDLAGAIVSFCDGLSYGGATSSLRKPIPISLNLEKVKSFIKAYAENVSALSKKEKADLAGEMCVRWVKIMSLGIVRGDFNYNDVLQALPFQAFVEKNIPEIISNIKQ